MLLLSTLRRQRQLELCKFEVSRPRKVTWCNPVSIIVIVVLGVTITIIIIAATITGVSSVT